MIEDEVVVWGSTAGFLIQVWEVSLGREVRIVWARNVEVSHLELVIRLHT